MANKTLINGTSYTIKGGKTLVGGTGYNVTKGNTLVGGTGYSINFSYLPVLNPSWGTEKTSNNFQNTPTTYCNDIFGCVSGNLGLYTYNYDANSSNFKGKFSSSVLASFVLVDDTHWIGAYSVGTKYYHIVWGTYSGTTLTEVSSTQITLVAGLEPIVIKNKINNKVLITFSDSYAYIVDSFNNNTPSYSQLSGASISANYGCYISDYFISTLDGKVYSIANNTLTQEYTIQYTSLGENTIDYYDDTHFSSYSSGNTYIYELSTGNLLSTESSTGLIRGNPNNNDYLYEHYKDNTTMYLKIYRPDLTLIQTLSKTVSSNYNYSILNYDDTLMCSIGRSGYNYVFTPVVLY